MKILFQNRKKDAWIGGDYIQMEKTADALRSLGNIVDISEELIVSPDTIVQYDLVHLWNFSMPWTKYQLWVARKHKIPVVCSMIYHESDQHIPYNFQQIMANELSAAIFLSEGELKRSQRHIELNKGIVHIIPNGIDDFWFAPLKKTKSYVLTVGRIDRSKGQLAVAKACKDLGLDYVIIGERMDEYYAQECEDYGAIWVPKKDQKELVQYYADCSVYVLASNAEIFPLTCMEAAAQGKNIVISERCEWNIPHAEWCEYDNVESIAKAIQKSLKKDENPLKEALKTMTWLDIGKQIHNIYENIRNTSNV